jgi:hypothetical protein
MLSADDAKRAGMVDRVATIEETIGRLASGKPRVKSRPRIEAARLLMRV